MYDLLRARQILVDLVERNSIPVFKSLKNALESTKSVLDKVSTCINNVFNIKNFDNKFAYFIKTDAYVPSLVESL